MNHLNYTVGRSSICIVEVTAQTNHKTEEERKNDQHLVQITVTTDSCGNSPK